MKRDEVFLSADKRASDFEFNADVAEAFDDMLERSVPFYLKQQGMIASLCRSVWRPGTRIYDLGCSTATTIIGLCRELPEARFVGYDYSLPMLERARSNVAAAGVEPQVELRHADLNDP